ncbi:hypothetical protein [Natronosalvus vescus]|uniref:hypothetical protein n=1 Tax=Natronosalvus vescus TaxID=2953881 RepID=UPI00209109B4|nr:hypothetical protein [Natronosalvus vescus]
MPKRESEQAPLSERVVKEAVGVGMDTPMREPILEAVKEAEGTSPPAKRAIPAVGLFGIGTAIGYLLGQSGVLESAGEDGDGTDLDITSAVESEAEEEPESMDEAEAEGEGEDQKSGGMAGRLLVLLGIAVGAVLVWRRRQAEGDEWEPIEEFEPAVDAVTMDEDEEDESEEAAEADEDMGDDMDMDEEEAGGDDGEQDDGEEAEAES